MVWELLKNGENPCNYFDRLDEDVVKWITLKKNQFLHDHDVLLDDAWDVWSTKPGTSRKDDALWFQKYPKVQKICFALLDKRDIHDVIWKMLRPERAEIFGRVVS